MFNNKNGYILLTGKQIDLLGEFQVVSFYPDPFRSNDSQGVYVHLRNNLLSSRPDAIVWKPNLSHPNWADHPHPGMKLVYGSHSLSTYFESNDAPLDR
jgi:hypothetical protein